MSWPFAITPFSSPDPRQPLTCSIKLCFWPSGNFTVYVSGFLQWIQCSWDASVLLPIRGSFLFVIEKHSFVRVAYTLFTRFGDSYLGYFQFGAVLNKAAENTDTGLSVNIHVFSFLLCTCLGVRLLTQMLSVYLFFWSNCQIILVAVPFCIFTSNKWDPLAACWHVSYSQFKIFS